MRSGCKISFSLVGDLWEDCHEFVERTCFPQAWRGPWRQRQPMRDGMWWILRISPQYLSKLDRWTNRSRLLCAASFAGTGKSRGDVAATTFVPAALLLLHQTMTWRNYHTWKAMRWTIPFLSFTGQCGRYFGPFCFMLPQLNMLCFCALQAWFF